MAVRRLIRAHPALAYFALLISWSYLFWQALFAALPLDPQQGPTPLHILLGGLGASPSLFGILLAYVTGGKAGLRILFSRLALHRAKPRWYMAALLLFPGLNLAVYLFYNRLGGRPHAIDSALLAFAILGGSMSSLLEEFGWRGFALPQLQQRHNGLLSALLVGLAWGLWHLGLNRNMQAAGDPLANLLLSAWGPLGLTAISLIMAWVYNSSRNSLLLMLLLHFGLTSSFFVFGPPASSPPSEFLKFHLIADAVLWSVVGVILAFGGARRLTLDSSFPLSKGGENL